MQLGCESLTGNHDDPGQLGREDLNHRLQGSESRVLRPFCRVPPDGSRNVLTASSATDQALRLPTPETDRRGDLPGFLGRELLPHPKRCGEPGSWKTQWLRVPTPAGAGAPGAPLRAGEGVPCQDAARPGHRQGGGQPRGDHQGREPAGAAAHIRHDGLAEGDQPADGAEDPGPRQPLDDGDLPQFHRRAHPGRVRAEMVRTAHPRAIQQTGRLRTRFIGAGAFFCTRWGSRGAESLPHDVRRRSSQATSRLDGITAHRCLWVRTGSGIREARPHPRALPPPRTTWAKSATHVYSVLQSKWPLRASSRWTRGKEMEMIENRQNKADFPGVCHCQITTYDKESEVPRGAL